MPRTKYASSHRFYHYFYIPAPSTGAKPSAHPRGSKSLLSSGILLTLRLVAALLNCLSQATKGSHPSNTWHWWRTTGQPLFSMLKGAPCSAKLQREYLSFYVGHIIPHLGPTPAQFKLLSQSNPPIYPCSYFSDDHTPMEANIVLEDNGNLVMQFAMEPLSADGSPAPLEDCIRLLESLKNVDCIKQLDMTWNDICRENLAYNPRSEAGRRPSHFFLGRLDFIF